MEILCLAYGYFQFMHMQTVEQFVTEKLIIWNRTKTLKFKSTFVI